MATGVVKDSHRQEVHFQDLAAIQSDIFPLREIYESGPLFQSPGAIQSTRERKIGHCVGKGSRRFLNGTYF